MMKIGGTQVAIEGSTLIKNFKIDYIINFHFKKLLMFKRQRKLGVNLLCTQFEVNMYLKKVNKCLINHQKDYFITRLYLKSYNVPHSDVIDQN